MIIQIDHKLLLDHSLTMLLVWFWYIMAYLCRYVRIKKICGLDLCNFPRKHSNGDVVMLCNLQLSSLIIITCYVLCNCVHLFFISMIHYKSVFTVMGFTR